MQFPVFFIAAVSGFLCVVLGAFGAHYLKSRLAEAALHAWETAVLYQMFHTLALLLIGILMQRFPQEPLYNASAMAMLAGMLLFSGSIYLLSLFGWKLLGPVTPLGGLAFMLGWGLLAAAVWRSM
ncbi:MAG: DUF423 domain-containing protein [Gammaproteobacteria bacterium]|nr:DUF423 domain-containing protein [Gammaproteobacteria bacterium]